MRYVGSTRSAALVQTSLAPFLVAAMAQVYVLGGKTPTYRREELPN
jgi:hypothetical protein